MIIRSPPLGGGGVVSSSSSWSNICSRCLRTAANKTTSSRAFLTTTRGARRASIHGRPFSQRLATARLSAHGPDAWSIAREAPSVSAQASRAYSSSTVQADFNFKSNDPSSAPQQTAVAQDLPHRRRRARKNAEAPEQPTASEQQLPLDASATLSTHAASLPESSLRRSISTFLSLAKPRLSALIVLTTTSAYSLYPVPELLNPALTDTPSLSALTLLFLTTGTTLTCASANALNMLYEPRTDAIMTRTRNRPLVRGLVSPRGAAMFAIATAVAGVAALYYGTNPTVAFLGGLNIFIYAGLYTPLKQVSAVNTWVGAVVGAIPPLMGWAAAAGQTATGTGDWTSLLMGEHNYGGWVAASLLFAWQFPHFMALSWGIRDDYKAAGHRMLCWTNPAQNARVALRYSLAMLPICLAFPVTGVTDWSFAVTSLPLNLWLVREAWKFYKFEGHKGSARSLFWASVWHLPGVLVLAMAQKKGQMSRIYRSIMGEPLDEADEVAL